MARLLSRLRDFGIAGLPSSLLTWSQRVCEQIEAQFAGQQTQIDDITALQIEQADQLAKITDAQTRLAIGLSWTSPSKVLTARDAGTDAAIDIASHLRVYADGSQNTLDPQTIAGLAYSTPYGVYYDAPSLGSPAITYQATTDLPSAQHNFVPMRVFVGIVETPAAAGAPLSSGNTPPGTYSGPGSYNGGALP